MIYKPHYEALIQSRGYRILRTVVSKVIETETNLTMPEWTVLGLLADRPHIRPIEVAEILDVDPPFITVMLANLIKRNLITSKSNEGDKRSKLLVLTKKGHGIVKNLEAKVHDSLEHLMTGVNLADLKTYFKVLETVIKNDQLRAEETNIN